jgi:hypothetical protein
MQLVQSQSHHTKASDTVCDHSWDQLLLTARHNDCNHSVLTLVAVDRFGTAELPLNVLSLNIISVQAAWAITFFVVSMLGKQ